MNVVGINVSDEQKLVGSLLCHPSLVNALRVKPEDFLDPMAAAIVALIRDRLRDGYDAEITALQQDLTDNQFDIRDYMPEGVQARDVLSWMMGAETNALPPERVAGKLRHLRRIQGKGILRRGLEDALFQHGAGQPPSKVLATVIEAVAEAQRGRRPTVTTLAERPEIRDEIWQRLEAQGGRLRTGIGEIDRNPDIGGLSMRGITLGLARSSMGKTSFANRVALGVAARGIPVVMHGTETTITDRFEDMACSIAGLTANRLAHLQQESKRSPEGLAEYQEAKAYVNRALDWIRSLPLAISECGKTVDEMCGDILERRYSGQLGAPGEPGLVVADYLQDLNHVTRRGMKAGDKSAQVRYASKRLKETQAHQAVRIPFLVFAQISGEKGNDTWNPKVDPRPHMTSCQWASEAHQDSDEVFYLHREDYFEERARLKGIDWNPEYKRGATGAIEFGLLKRRGGRLTRVNLGWDGPAKWVSSLINGAPSPLPRRRGR